MDKFCPETFAEKVFKVVSKGHKPVKSVIQNYQALLKFFLWLPSYVSVNYYSTIMNIIINEIYISMG